MVEEKGLAQLVIKAVLDKEFRNRVAKYPEKVIEEEGYSVTPDELAGLKELKVEEWDAISVSDLDKRLATSGVVRGGFTPYEAPT